VNRSNRLHLRPQGDHGEAWLCCVRGRWITPRSGTTWPLEERGFGEPHNTATALSRDCNALKSANCLPSEGVLSPVELESRFEVYAEPVTFWRSKWRPKVALQMARTQIYQR